MQEAEQSIATASGTGGNAFPTSWTFNASFWPELFSPVAVAGVCVDFDVGTARAGGG